MIYPEDRDDYPMGGPDDETDLTEAEIAAMWDEAEPAEVQRPIRHYKWSKIKEQRKMDMNEYQRRAIKTAQYPREHAILYPLVGLANEAGEVLGKYKKVLRGDYDAGAVREKVLSELGDVLWYIACAADDYGANLSTLARDNLDKLADRAERGVIKGDGDTR